MALVLFDDSKVDFNSLINDDSQLGGGIAIYKGNPLRGGGLISLLRKYLPAVGQAVSRALPVVRDTASDAMKEVLIAGKDAVVEEGKNQARKTLKKVSEDLIGDTKIKYKRLPKENKRKKLKKPNRRKYTILD